VKNSWSVILLMLSGSAFGSDKMTCQVVENWHDDFGNYHYREVCNFSNGDRTVTDCTKSGCEVERTTADERKSDYVPAGPTASILLQTMPIPEVPLEPPKKKKRPSPVKVIPKEVPAETTNKKN